jgi:hypothetical protein
MAAPALRRAMVASGGTLLLLGVGTMAFSTLSISVSKVVVDRAKV